MIDGVGSRKLFISVALGMSLLLICEALCVAAGGYSASIAARLYVRDFLHRGMSLSNPSISSLSLGRS
jgi:hypothetical protein